MRAAALVFFLAVGLFFTWRLSTAEDDQVPMSDNVSSQDQRSVDELSQEPLSVESDIRRESALPIVLVRVSVEDDGPLPPASVFVDGNERAATNIDGEAELREMVGGQMIEVRATGCMPRIVRLLPNQMIVDVMLTRAVTVSGFVHDGMSGSSVVGAEIRSEESDWESMSTDAYGRFGPLMLPANRASILLVEKSGYLTKRLSVDGVSDDQMLIALHKGHAIAGQVLDQEENPIRGARITTSGAERVSTNEDGQFSVLAKANPTGELPLNIFAEGFAGVTLKVKPEADKVAHPGVWVDGELKATLVSCAGIKGIVQTSDGSAVKSGEVRLLRDGARSSDLGSSYLKALPSSASWMWPGTRAWPIQDGKFYVEQVLPWTSHTTLELLDGESGERTRKTIHRSLEPGAVHEVRWVLAGHGGDEQSGEVVELSGMVNVDGVPMEQGFVEWRQRPKGKAGSCAVVKGRYSGQVPVGKVGLQVYVVGEQGLNVSAAVLRGEHLREVYIPTGAAHIEDFSLELEMGTITGVVESGPAMEAVGDAPVFVVSGLFTWRGTTSASGEFKLRAPQHAEYEVAVYVDSVVHLEDKVRCGQHVRFVVGDALELHVRAKDEIGEPVACSVWWRQGGGKWWSPLQGRAGAETLQSEATGKVAGGAIEICVVPRREDLSAKIESVGSSEAVAGIFDVVLDPGLTLELDVKNKERRGEKLFILSEAEWEALSRRREGKEHAQGGLWTLAQQVIPHRLLQRRELRVGSQGKAAVSGLAPGTYRLMGNTNPTASEPRVEVVGPGVSRVTIW